MNNTLYKISVVIPTYNSGETIIRAIDSVFSQSIDEPIEVIIIDDGSTDNTRNLINKYPNSIKYFYQKNKGVASARNMGISKSQGSYIAFLDADDEWLPHKLEIQLSIFKENPRISVVSAGMLDIQIDGEINPTNHPSFHGDLFRRIVFYNPVGTSSVIIKRYIFNDTALRFSDVTNVGEDWLLWIRISARYKIYISNKILVNRYLLPNSLENMAYNNGIRKNITQIYKILKDDNVVYNKFKKYNIKKQGFIANHNAQELYLNGEYFKARQCIINNIKYIPIVFLYRQLIKLFIPVKLYKYIKKLESKIDKILLTSLNYY